MNKYYNLDVRNSNFGNMYYNLEVRNLYIKYFNFFLLSER